MSQYKKCTEYQKQLYKKSMNIVGYIMCIVTKTAQLYA